MTKKLVVIIILISISKLEVYSQNLNLTFGNTPTQLVQNGLIGSGIIVTNIIGQVGNSSTAIFTNNGVNGFSLPAGILLSTGDISNINSIPSTNMSDDMGLPGDIVLDMLSSLPTQDAQVLNFDFLAVGDSVEFDFVFSSEEYNEYVASAFNDIFGFFITGPGYTPNTNVALVPGTTIPVSINNVNNGSSTGTAPGPCMNCSYYIDNVVVPNPVDLAADGFTTVIKIKFAVQPCAQYSFKIAVADVSDGLFDTQVYIGEGTFIPSSTPRISVNGITQQPNDTFNLCFGDSVLLSTPEGFGYTWSNGETSQSISVSQPGIYQATYTNGSCFAFTSNLNIVLMDSIPTPTINLNLDTIYSNYSNPGTTVSWELDGFPISNPLGNLIIASQPGCYTMIVTNTNGCSVSSNTICISSTGLHDTSIIPLVIAPNPVTNTSVITTPFSDGSLSTIKLFDINGKIVYSKNVTENSSIEINRNGISDGLYFIQISNSESDSIVKGSVIYQ